jgi:hypothetical protein
MLTRKSQQDRNENVTHLPNASGEEKSTPPICCRV